jgi:putative cell wall-binding protein
MALAMALGVTASTLVLAGPPGADGDGRVAASSWAVDRVGEADRFATAARLSERFFSSPASVVFVASGLGFADALAGGAAAGVSDAPLLLTARDQLSPVTATELRRLKPQRVVLLGGPGAVSAGVEAEIRRVTGGPVERISGANRYETAVELSRAMYPNRAPVVFLASGLGFADGLAGGPGAAKGQGPLLLTPSQQVPEIVIKEIERLGATTVVVLGGTQAISESALRSLRVQGRSVVRRAGADRHATSVAISSESYTSASTAVLVTGGNFPDALAAGSLARKVGGPLLLTRSDCMPPAVVDELRRLQVSRVIVVGGTRAVNAAAASGTRCQPRPTQIAMTAVTVRVHLSVGMTRAIEYLAARAHVLGGPGLPVSAQIVSGQSSCSVNATVITAIKVGTCTVRVTGSTGQREVRVDVIPAPSRSNSDRPGGNILDLKPVYIRMSDSPDMRRDTNGEVASFVQGISDFISTQHPGFALRVDEVGGVPDVQHIQLPITTAEFLRRWSPTDNLGPLGSLLIEYGIDVGLEGFGYSPTRGFTDLEGVSRILVGIIEAPRGAYRSPFNNFDGGCASSSGNGYIGYFVRDLDGSECTGLVGVFKGSGQESQTYDAFRLMLDILRANRGCNAKLNAQYGVPLEQRPSSITSPQDPIGYGYAVGEAYPRVLDPHRKYYFQIRSGPDVGNPCVDLIYSPFLTEWWSTSVHNDRVTGRSVGDRPDDIDGDQVRVLYVLPADAPDRRWDMDGRLHAAAATANEWLYANGKHSVRFDTFGGVLDVGFVRLPMAESRLWIRPDGTKCAPDEMCPHPRSLMPILDEMGVLTPGKIHVLVWGGQLMPAIHASGVGCAGAIENGAFLSPVLRLPTTNDSNCFVPMLAKVPNSSNSLGLVMLHEVFHVLGGVDNKAPDADGGYHIGNDPSDLMGGSAGTVKLDPRRRNYWDHGRSDLADITRSSFLVPAPSALMPTTYTNLPLEWWAQRPPQWNPLTPPRR